MMETKWLYQEMNAAVFMLLNILLDITLQASQTIMKRPAQLAKFIKDILVDAY